MFHANDRASAHRLVGDLLQKHLLCRVWGVSQISEREAKDARDSLLLCSFSRIVMLGPLLESFTQKPHFFVPVISIRYRVHIVEQALYAIKNWLTTPIMFMPPSYL